MNRFKASDPNPTAWAVHWPPALSHRLQGCQCCTAGQQYGIQRHPAARPVHFAEFPVLFPATVLAHASSPSTPSEDQRGTQRHGSHFASISALQHASRTSHMFHLTAPAPRSGPTYAVGPTTHGGLMSKNLRIAIEFTECTRTRQRAHWAVMANTMSRGPLYAPTQRVLHDTSSDPPLS